MKSRPDFHKTTRAIVSMNREAGQNPQIAQKRRNAAMILTQRSSNGLLCNHRTGNGVSRSTDTQKVWTPHSCPIKN